MGGWPLRATSPGLCLHTERVLGGTGSSVPVMLQGGQVKPPVLAGGCSFTVPCLQLPPARMLRIGCHCSGSRVRRNAPQNSSQKPSAIQALPAPEQNPGAVPFPSPRAQLQTSLSSLELCWFPAAGSSILPCVTSLSGQHSLPGHPAATPAAL